MQMFVRLSHALVLLSISVSLVFAGTFARAQSSVANGAFPPPVTFTADQDHQNMMDQLGIKALRPGASGDEKAPNHANYDESKANPYPNLPDALMLNNGKKVTTAQMWWNERRPQIVRGLRAVRLWTAPEKYSPGDVVGRSQRKRDGRLPSRRRDRAQRSRGQFILSADQRESAHDAGDPGRREGPRACV